MKIVTAENGKKTVKISKSEWETIGNKHGWMIKTAKTNEVPAGTFSISVALAGSGKHMGSLPVVGLNFRYKGEVYEIPRNSWGDMEYMVQDIEQSFANEIQQASGTQNQQAQQNPQQPQQPM